ncbi:MAG: GDP-mannose 4,6-dehydratase [Marmoricola sp.]
MSRHLVTGASGQDGRLLVALLASHGHEVIACGIDPVALPAGVQWLPLDVTDEAAVRRTLGEVRPDVVHHLAAVSSVAASWADPALTDAVNRRGGLAVLNAARDVGARFVFASSSEILGAVSGGVADESTPLDPRNPYAEAKAAVHLAVQHARREGAAATNLILFGHTGPLQPSSFVIPSVCRQAVEGRRGRRDAIELHDPMVARDWGAATDVVQAFPAAAAGPAGDYVIATGHLHTLAEIAEWALQSTGVPHVVLRRAGERRRADVAGVVGSPRRAAAQLGWQPRTPLRDVVEQIVRTAAVDDLGG